MSQLLAIGKFLFELLESRRLLSSNSPAVNLLDDAITEPVPQFVPLEVDWGYSKAYITTPASSVDNVTLARFSGPLSVDQYSAIIDWGDGTTSDGTIAKQQDGSFAVVGSHDYDVKGAFDVGIQVDDTAGNSACDDHGVFTQVTGLTLVNSPELWDFAHDEDSVNYLGSFVDSDPSDASPYSVTITWGDGTTSIGSVVNDGYGLGVYGTHGYTESGSYTLGFTIAKGTQSLTASGQAQIDASGIDPGDDLPGWIEVGDSSTFITTPGTDLSDTILATFASSLAADQYTASIDWGDGTSSDAKIVQQSDGSYAVVGSHAYGSKGEFDVSVQVDGADGSSGYDYHRIFTQADPLVLTSAPSVWTYNSGGQQDLYVASFYDQNAADVSAYQVTINWGDGSTSTGQVSVGCDGSFDVTGNHDYGTPGNYDVSVSITRGSQTLQASGTADVADASQIRDWPIYWFDRAWGEPTTPGVGIAIPLPPNPTDTSGDVDAVDQLPTQAEPFSAPTASAKEESPQSSVGLPNVASQIFQTRKKVDDVTDGDVQSVLS